MSLEVVAVSTDPLDSFDHETRHAALQERVGTLPPPVTPAERRPVNMHLHTFFSFNSAGYSPTHIAVLARQWRLYAAATCDFDVLDAADEFLDACLLLGQRGAVNIESRTYAQQFAEVETNSPGEPGVCYVMGSGMTRTPREGDASYAGALDLRRRAGARNAAIVERINAKLPDIAVSYADQVVPMTPGQSPTERHIVRAYVNRARQRFGDQAAALRFWAEALAKPVAELEPLSRSRLEEAVRRGLIKCGGLAYETPSPSSFPKVGDFFSWVVASGGIPMAAWRDGTSAGERDPSRWLDMQQAAGAEAVNIVPELTAGVLADGPGGEPPAGAASLAQIVTEAVRRDLPINVGTEMNADDLPDWDDLESDYLAPHRAAFVAGAELFVGHTLLARFASFPYTGAAARDAFPERAGRNAFFAAVGRLPSLSAPQAARLAGLDDAAALASIHDAVARGAWHGG